MNTINNISLRKKWAFICHKCETSAEIWHLNNIVDMSYILSIYCEDFIVSKYIEHLVERKDKECYLLAINLIYNEHNIKNA